MGEYKSKLDNLYSKKKDTLKNIRLSAENIIEAVRVHQKSETMYTEELEDINELAGDILDYIKELK